MYDKQFLVQCRRWLSYIVDRIDSRFLSDIKQEPVDFRMMVGDKAVFHLRVAVYHLTEALSCVCRSIKGNVD